MSGPSLRSKLRSDPYVILGLDRNADDRKIKAAYYREARRWHPDKQQNPERLAHSTAQFQQVQQAYEQILGSNRVDPAKISKPNCKGAAANATGTCPGWQGSVPKQSEPKRSRPGDGRGAPLFTASQAQEEERRWQEVEEHMQREAEEVMGRSPQYAEEVLRRRHEQQKASLEEMLKQAQERKRRQSESINEKLREWSLKQKVAEGAYLPHTNPSSDSKKAMPEEQADAPRPDAPDQSDQSGAATSRKNRSREGSEGRTGAMGCSVSESGPLPRRVLDPTGPDPDPPDHGSLGRGDDTLPAKPRATEAGKVPPTPMTLVQDRRRRSHRTESQSSARTKSRRSQSRKDRKGRREGTHNCSGPPPRPPELLAKALPKAPAEHKTVDSDPEDEATAAAAMVLEGNRPAVWRWYLLFRILLLLSDRGRAKAHLGNAVMRLASQWSLLTQGLLRRSLGTLRERTRRARKELILEQWASFCAALLGQEWSQEHLRRKAQQRIKASRSEHLG